MLVMKNLSSKSNISTYHTSDPFQFFASLSDEYPGSTMYTGQVQFLTDSRDDYPVITLTDNNQEDFMKVESVDDYFGVFAGCRYILCQVVPKNFLI